MLSVYELSMVFIVVCDWFSRLQDNSGIDRLLSCLVEFMEWAKFDGTGNDWNNGS